MKQVLMGGCQSTTASTRYMWVDGYGPTDSTQDFRGMMIAEDGTISNLQVALTVAPGGVTARVFTLMVDGAASALTVTISGTSTTGADTSNSVAVTAGQWVAMRQTHTGTPAAALPRFACEYSATAAQTAAWGSATSWTVTHNSADSRYAPLGPVGQDAFAVTTDAGARAPWSIACNIKSLYVKLFAAPGAGDSRAFTVMVNGVATGSTVTISEAETTGNATGMTCAIAPGDLVSLRETGTGTPASSNFYYGISYTPTTDGQWHISGLVPGDITDGFFGALGYGVTPISTEIDRVVLVDSAGNGMKNWRISNLYFTTAVAPGAGDTRTLTVHKTGAPTALSAVISDAAVSASLLGTDVTLLDDDYLSVLFNKSAGADATTRLSWSLAAGPRSAGGSGGGGGGGQGGGPRGGGGGPGGGRGNERFVASGRKRLRY